MVPLRYTVCEPFILFREQWQRNKMLIPVNARTKIDDLGFTDA